MTICYRRTGNSTHICPRSRTSACILPATTVNTLPRRYVLQCVVVSGARFHVTEHSQEARARWKRLHDYLKDGARLIHVGSEQTARQVAPCFLVVFILLNRLQVLCNLQITHTKHNSLRDSHDDFGLLVEPILSLRERELVD